ncbi:hypothetical protein TRFO_03553 [Tritrichomonas foetus]|uniref:Uncharacterized protein n=1 Tax=Tritrichomonas foetus TaxID=1144522 RepID=A0A1J4KMU1_9EUKA|nr:hypothetical protein TRFO_03553 [Tritrichomonas foetus]|eukprot:OHT12555.1 hypothetical protein TRFO_03553 [Tritrichomonas foetus]
MASDQESLFFNDNEAFTIPPTGTPMTAVSYNYDGTQIAFSNQPGKIQVVSSYDGSLKHQIEQTKTNYPVTGIRFHPSNEKMVLSTHRDGYIFFTNASTGENKCTTRHLGSNLLAMNMDVYGETFAIACADGSLRVYDFESFQRTKALVKMITRSATTQVCYIYDIVFYPDDSNIILAAGWNEKVLFWDIRSGNPERSIIGPHIRGQGLDIYNDTIVTASAKDKRQIEFWDFGTAKKITDINIEQTPGHICSGTCLKVASNGLNAVAGTNGSNLGVAVEMQNQKIFGQSKSLDHPVSSVGVSPFGSSFLVGTDNGEALCYMIRAIADFT